MTENFLWCLAELAINLPLGVPEKAALIERQASEFAIKAMEGRLRNFSGRCLADSTASGGLPGEAAGSHAPQEPVIGEAVHRSSRK